MPRFWWQHQSNTETAWQQCDDVFHQKAFIGWLHLLRMSRAYYVHCKQFHVHVRSRGQVVLVVPTLSGLYTVYISIKAKGEWPWSGMIASLTSSLLPARIWRLHVKELDSPFVWQWQVDTVRRAVVVFSQAWLIVSGFRTRCLRPARIRTAIDISSDRVPFIARLPFV